MLFLRSGDRFQLRKIIARKFKSFTREIVFLKGYLKDIFGNFRKNEEIVKLLNTKKKLIKKVFNWIFKETQKISKIEKKHSFSRNFEKKDHFRIFRNFQTINPILSHPKTIIHSHSPSLDQKNLFSNFFSFHFYFKEKLFSIQPDPLQSSLPFNFY